MSVYYNDHDPAVCAWLRELIACGLLPEGDVDDRSILDVRPADLEGYTACHFFAGIGGWAYALRLAGWPDDRPVWTGSPPCQPFSAAGQRRARDDDRHLAPAFLGLVRACRPPVLFGEQVASASVVGKAGGRARRGAAGPPEWAWLDDLSDGLEAAGYAVGAADLPAAGVGAPHIRQRLFFGAVRLADADGGQSRQAGTIQSSGEHGQQPADGGSGRMADATGERHDGVDALLRRQEAGRDAVTLSQAAGGGTDSRPRSAHEFWRDADWLFCRDGKWRPVRPGSFPLADWVPARVVRLRGYGNAIVPQVAAEFVQAFGEALTDAA